MSHRDNPAISSLRSADLLDALGAAKNWRAMVLTGATLFIVAMLMALAGYLAWRLGFIAFAFSLIALAAGLVGYSAVGAQLIAEARGAEPPSLTASILMGLASAPRLIGAVLAILAFLSMLILGLTLILLVCKIPYLGSALYAVVLPIGSVIVGVAIFAVINVSLALMAPAIWDGNSIFNAISRLIAVVRQRPFEILTRLTLLALLVGFAMAIIGWVLASGYAVMQGLAGALNIGAPGLVPGGAGGTYWHRGTICDGLHSADAHIRQGALHHLPALDGRYRPHRKRFASQRHHRQSTGGRKTGVGTCCPDPSVDQGVGRQGRTSQTRDASPKRNTASPNHQTLHSLQCLDSDG